MRLETAKFSENVCVAESGAEQANGAKRYDREGSCFFIILGSPKFYYQ